MGLKNGLIGGFAGSAVLAVVFVMKDAIGMFPQMDVIAMLSAMMGTGALMAWLAHFMIGTIVWGGIFGLANDVVPGGTQTAKGVVVGIGAWILMMVAVMPMAGAGFFGLGFGMMVGAGMPLVLHIVFGAVMGFTAAFLEQGSTAEATQ